MAEALGLTSTHQPFPEKSHEKIADAISQFEGSRSPAATEALAPTAAESAPPPIAPGTPMTGTAQGVRVLSPQALSVLGGGVGATVGAGVTAAQKSAGLLKDIYGRAFPGAPEISRTVEPTFTGGVAENIPEQTTRILQGGEGETLGTTGRARQEGYNIETAQRAAAKKEADVIAELAKRAGVTELTASQYLASQPGLTSSPAGILSPRVEARQTIGPRVYGPAPIAIQAAQSGVPAIGSGQTYTGGATAGASIAAAVAPPVAPSESTLGLMSKYWGKVAPVAAPVAKIGMSALGGALGANQIYNAELDRQKHGLTARNAMDYASGAGGLLATIPTVPTQVAGTVMQLPAAAMSVKDWVEQNPKKAQRLIDMGVFDQMPGQP